MFLSGGPTHPECHPDLLPNYAHWFIPDICQFGMITYRIFTIRSRWDQMRSDTEQIPPDLSQPSDIHNAPKKLQYCKSIYSTVLALILLCSKVNNAVQYIGCETPASCVKDSSFTSFWQRQKLISLLRGSHSITTNALISIEANYDTNTSQLWYLYYFQRCAPLPVRYEKTDNTYICILYTRSVYYARFHSPINLRCVPMLPECMPTPSRWITMQLRTDNSVTLSRLFLTVKNNRVSLPNWPRTPMPSRCIPDAFQNESRVIPMSTDWNRSRIGIVQNQDRDGSGTVLDGNSAEWDRRLTSANLFKT